jgi:protein-arginine kinase activator protein McsA
VKGVNLSEYLRILRHNAINSNSSFLFRRLQQVESEFEEDVECDECGRTLMHRGKGGRKLCAECKEAIDLIRSLKRGRI